MQTVREQTEATTDGLQDVRAAVWTSKTHLNEGGRKFSTPYSLEAIKAAAEELEATGDLFGWNGLLTAPTEDRLQTVLENEDQSDTTRAVLVSKTNKRLQQIRADG